MFLALGYDVKKLERSKFGEITLEGMNPGEYRHLTKSEIENVSKKTN
jgi:23S rRNA pseudouridine2605 synthase